MVLVRLLAQGWRRQKQRKLQKKEVFVVRLEDENMFPTRMRTAVVMIIRPPSSTLTSFVFLADHALFLPVLLSSPAPGSGRFGSGLTFNPPRASCSGVCVRVCVCICARVNLPPCSGAGQEQACPPIVLTTN